VLADAFPMPDADRAREALHQKLLGDLTSTPLALDGVRGDRTAELRERHPDLRDDAALRAAWRRRFDTELPDGMHPRITHAPRVAFVLADFHSGSGSCRVAALQALCNELCGTQLAVDGKWGPKTRAALPQLLRACVADDGRRAEFELLLQTGDKPRWLTGQLLAMARDLYRERRGVDASDALVPELWFDNTTTRLKGLGRISVAGYVAGSTAFYEDYLRRLCEYAGRVLPGTSGGR